MSLTCACGAAYPSESYWRRFGTRVVTCPSCGATVEAPEAPAAKSAAVIPDTIPGGMVIENLGPTPVRFDSKSDWKAAMKARGVVNAVRHVPGRESDKNPHTTRWH